MADFTEASPNLALKEPEQPLQLELLPLASDLLALSTAPLEEDPVPLSLAARIQTMLYEITDADLKVARVGIGLAFVGFGALMMAFLLLYLKTFHPALGAMEQIRACWHPYIFFVSLGVSGLFLLGRETLRPPPL